MRPVSENIVTVVRDGKPVNIDEDDLRMGDTLLIQAGDLVPADLRLTQARGLEVDEWELTGEILPVAKRPGSDVDGDVDGNAARVYRGSRVTRGEGSGVVIATGADTEYAQCLLPPWERTPYARPLLLRRQSLVVLLPLLPPLGLAVAVYGWDARLLLLAAVLAVVVVLLENSDLFAHLMLMREARAIARSGIRLRDAAILETVERLNVACLDKTGVMTARDLSVKRIYLADAAPDLAYFAGEEELAKLVRLGCALCNDVVYAARVDLANPVDQALIRFAGTHGADIGAAHQEYRRVYDKPFDSEARYMACGFAAGDSKLYFAKGDPDVVLQLCQAYATAAGRADNQADFEFWLAAKAHAAEISRSGDVAIALAYARRGAASAEDPPAAYTFLGLLHLENPLQPSVPGVLRALRGEGIRPLMLTGDRPETALKIGHEAGLAVGEKHALTGKQLAHMAAADIAHQAMYVTIFARLLPAQKGVLVRLLQQKGKVVAMVGDGANDTVALAVADVGIAFLHEGSPLARRVAPILINDLADVATVVRGARRMRRNVDELAVLRAIVLLALFLSLYGWVTFRYTIYR
jgi:magnesium-transporting ATPase (P-type)